MPELDELDDELSPHIGRNLSMHETITKLTEELNPQPVVIVHGDKSGIGKTRFLREICLFLN